MLTLQINHQALKQSESKRYRKIVKKEVPRKINMIMRTSGNNWRMPHWLD
jgi:hypothetical protein